jgi:hypothetical protein
MPNSSPLRHPNTRLSGCLGDLFGLAGAILGLAVGVGASYLYQGPPPPQDAPESKIDIEAWSVYLAVPGLVGLLVGACAGAVFGAVVGKRIDRGRAEELPP